MSIILHRFSEAGLGSQPSLPGAGALVLCAPGKAALDFATKLYPDRRLEVRAEYDDPSFGPGTLSLLAFLSGLKKAEESPEKLKARVVACATKLIGLSKSDGEGALVAGPVMLRLLSFKLASIGYRGPFLSAAKPGSSREFKYEL